MVGGSPEDSKNVPPGQLTLVKPNGSGMVAFDRNTGKEVYRTGNYLASYSAPILADIDGKTWCLALMREGLFVFDPDTGKEADFFAWRAKSNESVNAASPVVLGNEIFVSETYEIGSVRLRFENQKLSELWKDPARQRDQLMRAHWATRSLMDNICLEVVAAMNPIPIFVAWIGRMRKSCGPFGPINEQICSRSKTTL